MDAYFLCPIYSFEFDNTKINLPENTQIIKAPREFIEYIEGHFPHSLPTILSETDWVISFRVNPVNSSLSIRERFSRAFYEEDNIKSKLIDLITAFRLFKKGGIVAGLLISGSINNSKWSVGGNTIWTPISNITFFKEDPIYKLKQSELTDFISLFNQIRVWRISGALNRINIALERFHSSYHGDIEDRIIDQMIAFESLYLGSETELTYKLAMRTAFLLRNRKDFRKKVFINMKKAYRFRSEIVHGDNPPTRTTLNIIVPKIQDYLRESIKNFLVLLSQSKSLNEIRENLLDQNIISNGRTLKIP